MDKHRKTYEYFELLLVEVLHRTNIVQHYEYGDFGYMVVDITPTVRGLEMDTDVRKWVGSLARAASQHSAKTVRIVRWPGVAGLHAYAEGNYLSTFLLDGDSFTNFSRQEMCNVFDPASFEGFRGGHVP